MFALSDRETTEGRFTVAGANKQENNHTSRESKVKRTNQKSIVVVVSPVTSARVGDKGKLEEVGGKEDKEEKSCISNKRNPVSMVSLLKPTLDKDKGKLEDEEVDGVILPKTDDIAMVSLPKSSPVKDKKVARNKNETPKIHECKIVISPLLPKFQSPSRKTKPSLKEEQQEELKSVLEAMMVKLPVRVKTPTVTCDFCNLKFKTETDFKNHNIEKHTKSHLYF